MVQRHKEEYDQELNVLKERTTYNYRRRKHGMDSPENLWKLSVYGKLPHQKVLWALYILCSDSLHSNIHSNRIVNLSHLDQNRQKCNPLFIPPNPHCLINFSFLSLRPPPLPPFSRDQRVCTRRIFWYVRLLKLTRCKYWKFVS